LAPANSPNPIVAKTPARISTKGLVENFTIKIAIIIKAIPDISKTKLSLDFPILFIAI